jgi:hypothetical protein
LCLACRRRRRLEGDSTTNDTRTEVWTAGATEGSGSVSTAGIAKRWGQGKRAIVTTTEERAEGSRQRTRTEICSADNRRGGRVSRLQKPCRQTSVVRTGRAVPAAGCAATRGTHCQRSDAPLIRSGCAGRSLPGPARPRMWCPIPSAC